MKSLGIPTLTLYVKRTGLTFYDISRLIGVAHLFFGPASAEVEDKGGIWMLHGPRVIREEDQIEWALANLPYSRVKAKAQVNYEEALGYFKDLHQVMNVRGNDNPLMQMDTGVLRGVRGVDPLRSYSRLAPQTGEIADFKDNEFEIAASALGIAYAARAFYRKKKHTETLYILPVFSERFVLGGFLYFRRNFHHNGGGFVAAVWATLSILADLEGLRLPAVDFAYNRIIERTFYESGSLGFEGLCTNWYTGSAERKRALREIKIYLEMTRRAKGQALELARTLAQFAVNPTVETLELIMRLKARLFAGILRESQQQEGYWARDVFKEKEVLQEVAKMSIGRAVQVPESLVWAVANALIPPKTQREEAKGWFNKFVRLENIGSPDRFITEIERILSRATYDPQGVVRTIESKEGKTYPLYNPSKEDIEVVRSLIAHDERTFRAFKAVFLMEVLSKLRASGGAEAEGESEEKAKED